MDTPARFHLSAPTATQDGTYLCTASRPAPRPVGGAASGATANLARKGAMEIVADVVAGDRAGEVGRG